MATLVLHHATYDTPEECEPGTPIACATCGTVWDEEDDFGETFKYVDGEAHCLDGCYAEASKAAYRAAAASEMTLTLNTLVEELEQLSELYHCDITDPGDPRVELDDFRNRLKLYAAGKDTGYRSEYIPEVAA